MTKPPSAEFAGIKFSGFGKILALMTALSGLGGASWTVFLLYQEFLDLRAQVERYEPPDLSLIDKKLVKFENRVDKSTALVDEQIGSFRETVSGIQDDLFDLKVDMKDDASRLQNIVDKMDVRNRGNVDTVRSLISDWESRIDVKMARQNDVIDTLSTRLDQKIRVALENPIAAMNK